MAAASPRQRTTASAWASQLDRMAPTSAMDSPSMATPRRMQDFNAGQGSRKTREDADNAHRRRPRPARGHPISAGASASGPMTQRRQDRVCHKRQHGAFRFFNITMGAPPIARASARRCARVAAAWRRCATADYGVLKEPKALLEEKHTPNGRIDLCHAHEPTVDGTRQALPIGIGHHVDVDLRRLKGQSGSLGEIRGEHRGGSVRQWRCSH